MLTTINAIAIAIIDTKSGRSEYAAPAHFVFRGGLGINIDAIILKFEQIRMQPVVDTLRSAVVGGCRTALVDTYKLHDVHDARMFVQVNEKLPATTV